MADQDLNRLAHILTGNSSRASRELASTVNLRVRTELFEFSLRPPAIDPATGEPAPGQASAWNPLRFLRPEIVVETPLGAQAFAPYGPPTGRFRLQALGLAVGAGGALARVLGAKTVGRAALIIGGGLVLVGELKRRLS